MAVMDLFSKIAPQRSSMVRIWGMWWLAFGLLALIWFTKLAFSFHEEALPPPRRVSSCLTSEGRNLTDSPENVATVIEGRPIANFVPLILHFASVLGPGWPIVVFTKEKTIPESIAFRRAIEDKRIEIRQLPSKTDFAQRGKVSDFLTTPWLWEQLAPAKHVLLFQTDSIICSNSPVQIESFLEYDLVGAPIAPGAGNVGMNGGFSLRNRTTVLDILSKHSWKEDVKNHPGEPTYLYEDQWYYLRMNKMAEREDGGYKPKIPTPEVANTFSTETMWYDKPLGFHQAERFNGHHMEYIDKYCPEHKMATTQIVAD